MDGRAQLEAAARAINGASDIDAAWAGSGPAQEMRKQCGICSEQQYVRVPFLRHQCLKCASIWVPGICTECAHTSITFTMDGQLSPFAKCGCSGRLRQVAYVPKPREYVAPEVAAAKQEALVRTKKRATWTSRTVLVVLTVAATIGCIRVVHHTNTTHHAPVVVQQRILDDSASLTPTGRGRLAAQRLEADGRPHDTFSCAAVLPDIAPRAGVSADAGSKAFLAACLAG